MTTSKPTNYEKLGRASRNRFLLNLLLTGAMLLVSTTIISKRMTAFGVELLALKTDHVQMREQVGRLGEAQLAARLDSLEARVTAVKQEIEINKQLTQMLVEHFKLKPQKGTVE